MSTIGSALRFVAKFLGLIGLVFVIWALAEIAEPGPQISSFGPTQTAFAKPAGDPIGALIRQSNRQERR